jgi:adenosylhomocysteinase
VIVAEVNSVRAIEALMDGFEVMPMMKAVKEADMIITATGCKDIVGKRHLETLKDGCILGNSGPESRAE